MKTRGRGENRYGQAAEGILTDSSNQGLVQDAEHGHNILPFGLRNELRDDANVVERSLSIGEAHDSIEEVVLACLATVVVGVGGAGYGVEVEVNADTIFPAPLEDTDNVPKKK